MIIKDYYQNINVHRPRDYFERWYADVWKRRIGAPTAPPGILERILEEELENMNKKIKNINRNSNTRFESRTN